MKYLELLEQLVNEINMSPGSLRQLSAGINARAGMEFEMYFPGIGSIDDDDEDFESEPDYDYDESINDFDDISRFFHDGDHNSSRAVQRLINSLENDFNDSDWLSEKKQEAWDTASHSAIHDLVERDYEDQLREQAEDEVQKDTPEFGVNAEEFSAAVEARYNELFDEKIDEILSDMGDEYDEAYNEWEQNDWPDLINDEDLQREWLESEGYNAMSDISNSYDIEWPHWTEHEGGNSAEANLDTLADSFGNAVGKHVNYSTSYHGARRNPTDYALEPDGSLDEKEDEDDAGVEFVSPPMPVQELLQDLHAVKKWADRNGCYTNESTGLHINVSVPGFSMEKLDYVKLAILLGDEYILKEFGRLGNYYCKSAFQVVKKHIAQRPDDVAKLLGAMKEHLTTSAAKLIHSGSTDKYTSINTKGGYIEFRSPGKDWLNENFDKIENTLMRFVVALDAALDETKYKQEYAKKLYKILNPQGQKDEYGDMVEEFSRYLTALEGTSTGEDGKMSPEAQRAVADFRRIATAKLKQKALVKNMVPGKKYWWRVEKEGLNAPNGAIIELVATSKAEAIEKAAQEWGTRVSAMPYVDAEPLRPYEEQPEQPQTGNWGIWAVLPQHFARLSTTPGSQIRRFESEEAAQQWLNGTSLNQTRFKVMAIPADYQHPGNTGGAATAPAGQPAGVNSLTPTGPGPWELYYRSTGAKISELFNSHRPDAEREARVIVTSRNFNPALFGVRTQQQAAAPSQSGPWEIINTTNNQLFTVDGQPRHFPSEEEARSWLRGMGLTGSNFVVRSAGDTPSRYEIYDTDTGETKEAFNSANDQSAQEYLEDYRRMGPHAHGPDEAARRFGVRRART